MQRANRTNGMIIRQMSKNSRRMRGRGKIGDFLKKVTGFLKKHKILSVGAQQLAPVLGKYGGTVSSLGKLARQSGYGSKGKGLRLAGSGLSLAGGGLSLAGGRRRRIR